MSRLPPMPCIPHRMPECVACKRAAHAANAIRALGPERIAQLDREIARAHLRGRIANWLIVTLIVLAMAAFVAALMVREGWMP